MSEKAVEKEKPPRKIKVRPPSEPMRLSSAEMARRLEALQAHFSSGR